MTDTVKRLALYGVLALCLCGFAYVQGRADQQAALTFEHAQQVLAGHGAYTHLQDSLGRLERGFVATEAFWRAKADSLSSQTRSSQRSSALTRAANSSISSSIPLHPYADSLRVIFLGRALDACDASRGAADSALALCRMRGDTLEASLRAVLKARTPRFGFFLGPCISSTLSGHAQVGGCLGWGIRF
jgi:hypothetical protein